ncbi:bacteriohemerythrin [Agarilytica rhodophyticola]|uniref:bacteriohemerythrin n=1 Tax=Agarilytica rhodophyticola TaxID=1737490 RepID=UPI000B341910|nr:bacteriohemerythrin [Agarilytica rhodophyticola]
MSEYLKWTSDLNTNIHIIDQQHRKIADYINLLQTVQITKDRDQTGKVIADLIEYTISHFSYEEALMEEAGYPFLAPHKKVHQLFIDKINKYVARFEAGEDITEELLAMLKNWLINHIKNEDGDYADLVFSVQDKLHHAARGGLITRMMRVLF